MSANPVIDGLTLTRDLTQPEPVPAAGIARAVELMQSGRLHRYGETGGRGSETALLEEEFAASVGARYCVAMSSCGATLFAALKAHGVKAGDPVLSSAFTLAPVPGAIAHANARAVWVEMSDDCTIDLGDLERKAADSAAKVLLLSHMRGHVSDLPAVAALCRRLGIALIEDCAHTMGAHWDGRPTGTFGAIGCFSAQTYKHINSGEGGLLVTDDDDIAAQVILMSGSYMLYGQHLLRPADAVFERWRYITPNFSLRMPTVAAAMLRPQLALLPQRVGLWNALYATLALALAGIPRVRVPARPPQEQFVGSSIQFHVDLDAPALQAFLAACGGRGLHIKWFGVEEPQGFTSHFEHWRYLEPAALPRTRVLLGGLCDMRIPLSLTADECAVIGGIVRFAMTQAAPGVTGSAASNNFPDAL